MGTVKVQGDLARIKIRDVNKLEFSDSDILSVINTIIVEIYKLLSNMMSNLVYTEINITTEEDVSIYTPDTLNNGFVRDGSWFDDDTEYLQEVLETDRIKYQYGNGQPRYFYQKNNGDIGYLPCPDKEYNITHGVWRRATTLTDYDLDDLPLEGIFDNYISNMVVVELLEILERDNSRAAVFAEIARNQAMTVVYSKGVRSERITSDMFNVGGI